MFDCYLCYVCCPTFMNRNSPPHRSVSSGPQGTMHAHATSPLPSSTHRPIAGHPPTPPPAVSPPPTPPLVRPPRTDSPFRLSCMPTALPHYSRTTLTLTPHVLPRRRQPPVASRPIATAALQTAAMGSPLTLLLWTCRACLHVLPSLTPLTLSAPAATTARRRRRQSQTDLQCA